ncbi:MAG TPA: hypothetical protein VN914_03510 [Polyangia bacterium]|nr:hypothetical protein [Polyangia bacterium]
MPAPDRQPVEGDNKLGDRIARRRFAEEVARKHDVDAGDVEHVLSNLTLSPIERLQKSIRRARFRGIARR